MDKGKSWLSEVAEQLKAHLPNSDVVLKVEPWNSGHLNKETELVGIVELTSRDG